MLSNGFSSVGAPGVCKSEARSSCGLPSKTFSWQRKRTYQTTRERKLAETDVVVELSQQLYGNTLRCSLLANALNHWWPKVVCDVLVHSRRVDEHMLPPVVPCTCCLPRVVHPVQYIDHPPLEVVQHVLLAHPQLRFGQHTRVLKNYRLTVSGAPALLMQMRRLGDSRRDTHRNALDVALSNPLVHSFQVSLALAAVKNFVDEALGRFNESTCTITRADMVSSATAAFGPEYIVLYPFFYHRYIVGEGMRGLRNLASILVVATRASSSEKFAALLQANEREQEGRVKLGELREIFELVECSFIICDRSYQTQDKRELEAAARIRANAKLNALFCYEYVDADEREFSQLSLPHTRVLDMLMQKPKAFVRQFLPSSIDLHRYLQFKYKPDSEWEDLAPNFAVSLDKALQPDKLSTKAPLTVQRKGNRRKQPSTAPTHGPSGGDQGEWFKSLPRFKLARMDPPYLPAVLIAKKLCAAQPLASHR